MKQTLLVELSWEVCNQSGGIYTVIASKLGQALEFWGDDYCLIGPYMEKSAKAEWEEDSSSETIFARAAKVMRDAGYDARYGYWLTGGRPHTVLVNLASARERIRTNAASIAAALGIPDWRGDALVLDTIVYGFLSNLYLGALQGLLDPEQKILAHYHEWMAAVYLPITKKELPKIGTIFTTHATLLGRYLASNDRTFYSHVEDLDWQKESARFWIECQASIERKAALTAHVFTSVSEVTARECRQFLGRNPDVLLPNGLNIQRFTALHEFQNLHQQYKRKIQEFVMGYFFPSYSFDLDQTLFFFTSGRFEYHNKGFDMTLDGLARLNQRLKAEKSTQTIVFFLITRQPTESLNPLVLQRRALLEELRQNTQEILQDLEEKVFYTIAASKDPSLPDLNGFVQDYWKFRIRKALQAWQSEVLPPIVTHNMVNSAGDEVLVKLRELGLFNAPDDPVKIVYHPDFVSPMSPLFGMEYQHFVRGCHLGVFPSYYEPWGYTPLESIANGIPTITSDLAGFGTFVEQNVPKTKRVGVQVVHRLNKSYDEGLDEFSKYLWDFCHMDRRERIQHRNKTENNSVQFDWKYLYTYYQSAYEKAGQSVK